MRSQTPPRLVQFSTQKMLLALTGGRVRRHGFDTKAYLSRLVTETLSGICVPRTAYFARALEDYPVQ